MLKQILSLPTRTADAAVYLRNITSRDTNTYKDIGTIQQHL